MIRNLNQVSFQGFGNVPPERNQSAKLFEKNDAASLPLSQALRLTDERILQALAEGKPVVLYTPGLPAAPGNRGLSAALASSRREMKAWGIVFTDGAQKKLITAQEARSLKAAGKYPGAGAVLAPLARESLEQ